MPPFLKDAYKKILENLNLLPFFKITSRKIECLLSGNFIEWHPLSHIHLIKPNDITHLWIDKAHLIPLEYQKIFSPYESYPFKIYLTFLPPSSDHWLVQNFFLSSSVSSLKEKKDQSKTNKKLNAFLIRKKILSSHMTHKDNPFLEKNYHQQLESWKEREVNFYHQFICGKIQKESAKAFPFLRKNKKSFSLSHFSQILVGIDFGFTHASVCLICAFKGGVIYVLKELYMIQKSPSEWLEIIEKFLRDSGLNSKWKIWADSEDPGQIKDLNKKGIAVRPTFKKSGSLKKGINWLQEHPILVNPNCPRTLQELHSITIKKDSPTGLKTPLGDDVLASLRYAVQDFIK